MRHLIFDFDGVLGDTYEVGLVAVQQMFGWTREQALADRDRYFTQSTHTRDMQLSAEQIGSMQQWVDSCATLILQQGYALFDGFIAELKKISNVRMAVVSSGSSRYIKPKLAGSRLAFTHILTFEDHHSKEEKVERICTDWGIGVGEAYFITDSVSDVRELSKIMDKDKIYACTWGYQTEEKLATTVDDSHMLREFGDIHKVGV